MAGAPPTVNANTAFPENESNSEPPSCLWNFPHRRNPFFIGRTHLLTELDKALSEGAMVTLTQSTIGLGGLGKTQIATEYAYRHAADYELIGWVRAEEPTTLAADYAALAEALNLPDRADSDQNAIIAAVRRHLAQRRNWLLIFDNAEKPEEVQPFLPQGTAGRAIITSRRPIWKRFGPMLAVPLWQAEEGSAFLQQRIAFRAEQLAPAANGKKVTESSSVFTMSLSDALGGLPLALEQAAAYINATGCTPAHYLDIFHTHHRQMQSESHLIPDQPIAVAATWELSFRRVKRTFPAGAALFNLCAFLAPDDIPLLALHEGRARLPGTLDILVADPDALERAVSALRIYSLVDMRGVEVLKMDESGEVPSAPSGDLPLNGGNLSEENEANAELLTTTWPVLTVHRVVQSVTRDRLSGADRRLWARAVVRMMDAAFPFKEDDPRTWAASERLLPHVLSAVSYAEAHAVAPEMTGRLLNTAGAYLQSRGQFAQARTLYERALRIDEVAYGPQHPNVARDVNSQGCVLLELGDRAGARAAFERALRIDEAAYGPNHPNVARDIDNLGSVLLKLGNQAGALAAYERALQIDEMTYGPSHPNVALRSNNLGRVRQDMGDLPGARAAYERALTIAESAFGPEHTRVALYVNNLAVVLHEQGNLAAARVACEHALRIFENTYGPTHPSVATLVNNLGRILQGQGDLPGARDAFQRALQIGEQTYGPDHPHLAVFADNLGRTLQALGDLPGAQVAFEHALRLDEATYGLNHPNVGRDLEALGLLLYDMRDRVGARAAFERALPIAETTYGLQHVNVGTLLVNLGLVQQELGDTAGARAAFERALAIFRRTVGDDHPKTQQVRANLAFVPGE